jgi:hypothetical protein
MLVRISDFERAMGLKSSLAAYVSLTAVVFCISSLPLLCSSSRGLPSHALLDPQEYRHYFEQFTNDEKEMLGETDPLQWTWFEQNIPWLDVPDKSLEEIYYFRWYSFQKHIKPTPSGFVIDEFAVDVPWAGKYNTISAAAGHHIREARWLRTSKYAEDYAHFWLAPEAQPRLYSFWAADSVYSLFLATGNRSFVVNQLPGLQANYQKWESAHQDAAGLYWQTDDRDGMEFSIGGSGYRPTINSYMYGDALAISRMASISGRADVARQYDAKAERLRHLIETRLWNPKDRFYETVSRQEPSVWSGVRELIGFVPWYFEIPTADRAVAWRQLFDPNGFAGLFGPTTAERRSLRFNFKNAHECLWNGPSWPFGTTQTLVALANLVNDSRQTVMSANDYFHLLNDYTKSQHIRAPDGRLIPWIDEDLSPDTGEWLARDILISKRQPPPNRGRYYNHSGYADLIITGLVGVRPSAGSDLVIRPLLPPEEWQYFALEGVPYHGHLLTIFFDRTGQRYHRGSGLTVLSDGRTIGHVDSVTAISVVLPGRPERDGATVLWH